MKLFVSYARVDLATATAVVADLQSLGHQPYFDQELVGGERWWNSLLDQIQQCDVFVPILSDAYKNSQACLGEAMWAEALGVPFMPLATDAQEPGLFDPVIAEANWVMYDPDARSALAHLARGISASPSFTLPDPLPERPEIPLSYMTSIDRQVRGPGEISRAQQLVLISDLRSKLGSRDETVARGLLAELRSRAEITYEAATVIDELLGQMPVPAPSPAPDPGPDPGPPPAPALPPTATPSPPSRTSEPRWAPPPPWALAVVAAAGLLMIVSLTAAPWYSGADEAYRLHDPDSVYGRDDAYTTDVIAGVALLLTVATRLRFLPRYACFIIGGLLAICGGLSWASTFMEGQIGGGLFGTSLLAMAFIAVIAPRPPTRRSA
jgi:hypothetical protein